MIMKKIICEVFKVKYHILRDDKSLLVSCDLACDRDDILDFFKEKYPDYKFGTLNKEVSS